MDLTLKNGIDPRLEALSESQNKMVFEIPQGAAYTNKIAQKANSVSNQSVSFNFNTQGKNVLIDRRFYCRMKFKVTGTFTNNIDAEKETLDKSSICPRAFPIASCAENVSVSINGTTVSANYADMMSAYLRYTNPSELLAYDLSGTPSQLDFCAEYPDARIVGDSPFASVGFVGQRRQLSRASFNVISCDSRFIEASTDDPIVAVREIEFEVVEPLMLSPLLYSSRNLESALLGVTNLAVNINFGDLTRVLSRVILTDSAPATFTANIVGTPELLIEYKNLQLVEESKIPQMVRYNYQRPEVYVNDTGTTLAASTGTSFGTATVNNNAIQLSACPKRIYIYASLKRGSKTLTDADTFIPITSLSLSYLNVSGQFSSYTQNDLYNMSLKNGYAGSFQEWSGLANNTGTAAAENSVTSPQGMNGRLGLSGSVLCIDSTDLALPSNIASGVLVNSQLQFQVGLLNNRLVDFPVTITCIVVNDGIMEISEGGMTTRIGVISSEDVLRVRSSGESTPLAHHTQLEGGGLLDFMSKISDRLQQGPPPKTAGERIKDLIDNMPQGGSGGALVAGRKRSKAELRSLLG